MVKNKASVRFFRKKRSDRYETALTLKEKEQLITILLNPKWSVEQMCRRAPPWAKGKRKGQQPKAGVIGRLAREVRMEFVAQQMEGAEQTRAAMVLRMFKDAPPDAIHEEMVNLAMQLISQEVITKTVDGLDPASRTAAARLMLKRSDQHLDRAKFLFDVGKFQEAARALREKHVVEVGEKGIPPEVMDRVEKQLRLM